MKILIADDEKLVRFSLKSMLEELDIPSLSIQVACDGRQLVERAGSMRPDIAFVDIRMPGLDGLQAIERALPLSPSTRWVILTSYSSFEYAHKAIGLGASEYLLKPVSPQELSRVVSRLRQESRESWLHANEEFEARINALFHNTSALKPGSGEFVSTAVFEALLVLFDSSLPEPALVDCHRAACQNIRGRFASVVGRNTRLALCSLPEGPLAMIGAWQPSEDARASAETVQAFLRKMQSLLQRDCPPEVSITCLQTELCASFDQLLGQLSEASDLASLRSVVGIGRTLPLGQLREWEGRSSCSLLGRRLDRLARMHREGSTLEFLKGLDEIEKAPGWRVSDSQELAHGLRFLRTSLGFQPVDPTAWVSELREWARRQPVDGQAPGDLVSRASEFLEANYMHDIGIAQIADYLGVTPNYLSGLFHRKKGTTFVKHLTRLRLTRASQMLAGGGARVQEVARAVGYASPRHFSRLFRQQFGCHPSEYPAHAPDSGV